MNTRWLRTTCWCVALLLAAACNKPRDEEPQAPGPPPAQPPRSTNTAPAEPTPGAGEAATDGTGDPVAGDEQPTGDTPVKTGPENTTGPDGEPVELVMLASASLEQVAAALAKQYTAATPGVQVRVVSSADYKMLRELDTTGGDILISEGFRAVEIGRAAGLVAPKSEAIVTWLPLTITVAGKQADSLRLLAHLTREGIKLGVPDPKRSTAGAAALRMLERAELADKITQRVLPSGAYSALRDGTVDAFITWGAINGIGVPMPLPARLREHLPGVAAPITSTKHKGAVDALMAWLSSPVAKDTWERGGTVPKLPANAPTVATTLPVKLRPPRRDAGCVAVDGRILVVGGNAAEQLLTDITWIDPNTMTTRDTLQKLRAGLEGPAVGWSSSRKQVLIAGGRTTEGYTTEIHAFSPENDRTQVDVARLPSPVAFAATAISGNRLVLFGGLGPGDKKSDLIISIDLATAASETASARLPTARSWLTALDGNGQTWLLGGESDIGGLSELIAWNPIRDTMTLRPERLGKAVRGMAGAVHDGGFLLIGGNTRNGPRDTVDRFTGPDRIERQPVRLPYPVAYGCAVSIDDKVYVVGGLSNSRIEGRVTRLPY